MRYLLTVFFILINLFAVENIYASEIFKSQSVFKESFDNASMPIDFIFGESGRFLLLDSSKGKIIQYNKGKLEQEYADNAYINGGCFVAIDNKYYICDGRNNKMTILDESFKPTDSINASKAGERFDPTDILKSKNGSFYIVDNDNHRLAVYDPKKRVYEGFLGSLGESLGSFNYPFSLVINNDNFIFISEVINTRVQMVSPRFKGVFAIGKWGVKAGELYRPKGLALYDDKFLIISDGFLGVLQVFNMKGQFVGIIGDENGKIKKYDSPTRIRINGDLLAIVDPYQRVVEVLRIGGIK